MYENGLHGDVNVCKREVVTREKENGQKGEKPMCQKASCYRNKKDSVNTMKGDGWSVAAKTCRFKDGAQSWKRLTFKIKKSRKCRGANCLFINVTAVGDELTLTLETENQVEVVKR